MVSPNGRRTIESCIRYGPTFPVETHLRSLLEALGSVVSAGLRKASSLAVLLAVFASCADTTANRTAEGFSSLSGEYEFWRAWLNEHMPEGYPLEPFFLEKRGAAVGRIDDELRAIAKSAEVFVLVIRVNIQNGDFEILSLAKDMHWQRTRWEDTGKDGWEKSVSVPSRVREDVLLSLSAQRVYCDASDLWLFDADSVYVFLRHKGKCSRFAIYNPQYEDASWYDPDDDTRKKVERDPVAASLKSLYEMVGISPGQKR